jgi:hypothetical protein
VAGDAVERVCVLMKRRCDCSANCLNTSPSEVTWTSSQGDTFDAAKSTRSNRIIPTTCCIHVVPHFGGVEMITSSGRGSKRDHRPLSMTPR